MNYSLLLTHVLFWVLYLVSEYFANLAHLYPSEWGQFLRATMLPLPILMAATYFLALYVVPRYLMPNKWIWFLLWCMVVAALVFYTRIKWQELVNYLRSDRYYPVPVNKMLKNIIRDYSIIALAVCIHIIGDYRRKQKLNEELIKAKAEVEIKLLKGQLHPHFLFNSLNNIYSLALSKSELTADSILKLTELLDYLVYRASMDTVPLAKEVQLLENYLGLEQLRYGEKLQVKADIAIQNDSMAIAPLLLLPFAENCFKHGGVGADGIFRVELQLYTNHKKLYFSLNNSKRKTNKTPSHSGGVGLENIQKRLNLLYPDRHQLQIVNVEEQYEVTLEITF
ncbi:MAG: histidine kinase [Haliscomenobacter sp.]|uniref:sensor histidine kinase n=1 Tax=Haliscomenobacter sp. TaxID=2717303 RepID=UPI0029BC12D0|nr:histidine kinase [Haliscomenobacter sp.]MDX2068501.1 histidine kinase [Haliscomenobacter sp.]